MKNNFSLKFRLFDIFVLSFAIVAIIASIITTNVVFSRDLKDSYTVEIYYQGKELTELRTSFKDVTDEKEIILKKEDYDGLLGNVKILINKEKGICIDEVVCPNHTCKKMGWVKAVAYPVTCLPNSVYVIITSSKSNQDSILG